MSAVASEFPWAVFVSGLVGIAGIAGTLLSAHLTNRAAEKRRLAEQQHEDRTRFHRERIEIYSRFIGAFNAYRESLYEQRSAPRVPDSRGLRPASPRAALAEVLEALRLLAADEVASAACGVFSAAISLENLAVLDPAFELAEKSALSALGEFRKAARAELLPDSKSAAANKKSAAPPFEGGPD